MLTRIFLIIAILAGLAVGGLNFFMVKQKVDTLVEDRNSERSQKEQAQTQLAKTRNDLAKTEKELNDTKSTLTDTQAQLGRAEAQASAEKKRADDLTQELAKTTADKNQAEAELAAYKATGYTAQQVLTMAGQIADLNESLEIASLEKQILNRALMIATNKLATITLKGYIVPLPVDLRGKVLVVDPKWDFVVLDFGANKNVLEGGELLVSRSGNLVAKLRIRDIQKDRCIANVVDGWEIGDIAEGDIVIPAHIPAS